MIACALFDLDGTLLDTAPDLVYALNCMRETHHLPPLSFEAIKPFISLGSKAMIKFILNLEESDPKLGEYRIQFLNLYYEHIAERTQFFPQMEEVLHFLELNHIPWGIVTNKPTLHTNALLKALNYFEKPGCIICGDTLTTAKPHPAPIQHALRLLNQTAENALYIGDSLVDITACKAAGTKSLVALYGYINDQEDPKNWQADGYIQKPIEIIDWIKSMTNK